MLARTLLALVLIAHMAAPRPPGVYLDRLTWPEAQALLRADTIVVLPLGSAAAEHGPHMKLGTDRVLAEYLARRVADASSVVVAPALPYHHYPAFQEYPGSTSLSLTTARDMTVDVIRSLARFGPRRFYVLNMGLSSALALEPAATALAANGILLRYTDVTASLASASRTVRKQDGGAHADEVETSVMLHIDAASVDMTSAARDFSPASQPFRLTRSAQAKGTYSPTGIWGDATLATKEKGAIIVDRLVSSLLEEIDALRSAPLPVRAPDPPVPAAPPPGALRTAAAAAASSCTPGDERLIRRIAESFTIAWMHHDYETLSLLWTEQGDMVHPDGMVERTRQVILQNRRELFTRREYRDSRHPLTFGNVRCITADVAVVDGKWELRGVYDAAGKAVPTMEGLLTLVVRRTGGWQIDAYRYTLKPPVTTIPPTILKRPGYPGGQ